MASGRFERIQHSLLAIASTHLSFGFSLHLSGASGLSFIVKFLAFGHCYFDFNPARLQVQFCGN
jgi:hypothetical protein